MMRRMLPRASGREVALALVEAPVEVKEVLRREATQVAEPTLAVEPTAVVIPVGTLAAILAVEPIRVATQVVAVAA